MTGYAVELLLSTLLYTQTLLVIGTSIFTKFFIGLPIGFALHFGFLIHSNQICDRLVFRVDSPFRL